jgi:hypothetical protein
MPLFQLLLCFCNPSLFVPKKNNDKTFVYVSFSYKEFVLDGGRDLNEKMEGNWEIERCFFPCVFFVRDRVFVVLFDEFSLAFFFF